MTALEIKARSIARRLTMALLDLEAYKGDPDFVLDEAISMIPADSVNRPLREVRDILGLLKKFLNDEVPQ